MAAQEKTFSLNNTKHLGRNGLHFSTIDSTQTFIKEKLTNNQIDEGTVIVTDHQSLGKGTQGRSWFSLPRPQLMFSVLLKPEIPPQKLPIINLLSAVVLAEIFSKIGIDMGIKWPNDLYIGSRKVAGILSELVIQNKTPFVIQGIGINVDGEEKDFPVELRDKMTTISIHSKTKVDRWEILRLFLETLEVWLYSKSLSDIIEFTQSCFQKFWIYQDRVIEVQVLDQTLTGIANSIDANGSLFLNTSHGMEKIVSGTILTQPPIDKPAKNA